MFNARCGLTKEDDWLPARFFEPLQEGPLAGRKLPEKEFASLLALVYEMKCWDPLTARPTPGRLLELELDWLLEDDRR